MRARQVMFSLAVAAAAVCASQIPLVPEAHPVFAEDILTGDVDLAKWNLSEAPSPNATGRYIFDSASAFLQHWPNTHYRNGHNLVLGTVAKGALLYHGTSRNQVPQRPEWIATDPEHSYGFCRSMDDDQGCWHLTLVATRPLKVLYFDGSSAAKMQDGAFDTQDFLAWEKIGQRNSSNRMGEDEEIKVLCEWGTPFGVDGFVRMEMDFEIMLCDFTNGVSVLSFSNLASSRKGGPRPGGPGGRFHERRSGLPSLPRLAPNDTRRSPMGSEAFIAGHWHNHYPGENRVQLDYANFVSFYDTASFPSLVPLRAEKERYFHRLMGVSPEDIARGRQMLETMLVSDEQGSGVDWDVLLHVIISRYADRLEVLQYFLNKTVDGGDIDAAKTIQARTRVMLTPYILNSVKPPSSNSSAAAAHDWAAPAFKMCSLSHTAYIATDAVGTLTYSEKLLLNAVQETSREICRVITNMWAEGVESGLDASLSPTPKPDTPNVAALLAKWRDNVDYLMAWLDWNVWVKCRPACTFEEECYLPTWSQFGGNLGGGPGGGPSRSPEDPEGPPGDPDAPRRGGRPRVPPDDPDVLRPTPRCVARFEF